MEERIRKNQKYSFLTAVISMFIVHFYFYANRFICYEDLVNSFVPRNIYSVGALDHGRWFLPVAQMFTSNWSLPPVSGMVSGIVTGIIVILLIRLFEIQSTILSMFLSLVFTTFPTMACYNAYTHQAETFVIALALSTLAVFITEKRRFGFLIGGVLMSLSLGTYQVFVSYTIAVIYIMVLLYCIQEEVQIKSLFQKFLPFAYMMAIGAVLYVATTKILLIVTGIQMTSYHNANSALSLSNINIGIGIKPTIMVFLQYFFSTNYNSSLLLVVLNGIAMLICAAFVIRRLIANAKEKHWGQNLFLAFLVAMMPFGINSLPIVLGNAALNGNGLRRYMFFDLIVTYILFIVILDRIQKSTYFQEKMKKICAYAGIGILTAVVWGGYIQCNQGYSRANTVYESVYSYMTRIVARMEQVEEWNPSENPVYFANCTALFNSYYDIDVEEFTELFDMEPMQFQNMYEQENFENFLRIYLHLQVSGPTGEQKIAIDQSETFQQMSAYPASDSIQMIDGVLVIKMND